MIVPSARVIALGRHLHINGFVWSVMIVGIAELVEAFLRVRQIDLLMTFEQIIFERLVEALRFTLGLRMIRTSVQNADA